MPTKTIPFVLKDNFIQVIVGGKPFALQESHPTFKKMKAAIKAKEWKKIPGLVTLAENISVESHGLVTVKKDAVFYKDKEIHNSLSKRILDMIEGRKNVSHLIRFMNNLYQNPEPHAIKEFYDWLVNNDLPITDDGHFLAYKSVKRNNMDTHSQTVDNSPGQIIMMPRKEGDPHWYTQCSSGFHICSKQYGVYGEKTMAVKANPRDVLSAQSGKIRVLRYEVLMELGDKDTHIFKHEGYSELEKKLVVEVKKDRKDMIKMLLAHPTVKRDIRKKKMSTKTLIKSSYARLKTLVQRYELVSVGPEVTDNRALESMRKAAGLTIGQVAKQLKKTYKVVALLEKKHDIDATTMDSYIAAVGTLTGARCKTVSFPTPVSSKE
jgi:hypothetical protein